MSEDPVGTVPITDVVLEDEYLEAANTLRRNAHRRKVMDIEDEQAKEILAKVLTTGDTGTDTDGVPLVKMRAGNLVFNEAKARENLPADVLDRITVEVPATTVVDRQRAKDLLPPALYDQCCKRNKSSVVIA